MIEKKQFTHVSIYTEGFEVTETDESITVEEGLIFYNGTIHHLDSFHFNKETDENYPVYYQLSIVEDAGAVKYALNRTIITPRQIPGYSGGTLIHVLISFMLEVDGSTNGEVTYVTKIVEE